MLDRKTSSFISFDWNVSGTGHTLESNRSTISTWEVTAILWILRRASVALGYAPCRYEGSGGEDKANMKTRGSCGMYKLGLVGSVGRGRTAARTCTYRIDPEPPWAQIVRSRASVQQVVCPLHVDEPQVGTHPHATYLVLRRCICTKPSAARRRTPPTMLLPFS